MLPLVAGVRRLAVAGHVRLGGTCHAGEPVPAGHCTTVVPSTFRAEHVQWEAQYMRAESEECKVQGAGVRESRLRAGSILLAARQK